MITAVRLRKFKKFKNETIELLPEGITLVAGGNNSGKSSLLHGLAVWEFCRTAIEMEKGAGAFYVGAHHQGLGLGNDEFSPVAVPSLKHLWTNLRPQRQASDGETDGYTMRIACDWVDAGGFTRTLEFGLALANDRLFIRVTATNLTKPDPIPVMAYLPPFAGITSRETRVSPAIRRRRIGEGLAGAVLRNLLLDLYDTNDLERLRLKGDRSRILQSDLNRLRSTDGWELLQQTIRTRFNAELLVEPFKEEYHSYIRIELDRGEVSGHRLTRWSNYSRRDLMVEGSGFLQWLSVYALASAPNFDVLLLDEPDAHLHPTLQVELMESLSSLASLQGKQVLVATHSVELLRHWPAERILEVRDAMPKTRYLTENFQKVGLLEGLGSHYGPNLDPIRRAKRVLFVEGTSDKAILEAVAARLGRATLEQWPIWISEKGHKERKHLVFALREDIPGLTAVSLRDRDEQSLANVADDLTDRAYQATDGYYHLVWRRRNIDSYLLHPAAVARVLGVDAEVVKTQLADRHALAIPSNFTDRLVPDSLLDADGKKILWEGPDALLGGTALKSVDIARSLAADEICQDLATLLDRLDEIRAL